MNHFKISLIKSILRIASGVTACVLAILNIIAPAVIVGFAGMGIAEILGILEEIFDKRKEE